jgi:PAS domain S-box-containing protein
MFLWWSKEFYMFHNDGYMPSLGRKHPQALGAKAREVWAEIWPQMGAILEGILQGDPAFFAQELLVPLQRRGFLEDTYWTFSYSPMFDDEGKVNGIFCACNEVTGIVLSKQRLQILKDVYQATDPFQTPEQISQKTCSVVNQNPQQIPFALVYLLDQLGKQAHLSGFTQHYPQAAIPRLIDLATWQGPWPLATLMTSKKKQVLAYSIRPLEEGGSPVSVQVVLLPLYQTGQDAISGFVVLGINPRLEYDADYQSFHVMLAERLATALAHGQARQHAQREQQKLYALFTEAPAPIVILDGPDLVFELVNPAYQRIFPGRELLGKPLLEALPEVAQTPVPTVLRQVYQTGETFVARELPLLLARKEGEPLEEIYWTFTYQARRNGQGQVNGVLVFAYEVTDQVLARKGAEKNAQQLRLINDALPVLIGYLDKEEKYRFANRAYEPWFHQPAEALLGRPVREVMGEKAYQEVKGYIKRALAGERVDFEARMPYREDFVKYTRVSFVPDIRQGEVVGFYSLVSDVTEQVEARQKIEQRELQAQALAKQLVAANEELAAANQQLTYINGDLDTFVYTASHDLKAPILNLEGLLKALERRLSPEIRQQVTIREIYQLLYSCVDRFKTTIHDLTEVARISKESQEDVDFIALADVLEQVRLDLEPQIAQAQAELEVNLDCPLLHFSRKNLKSILSNLLSNALKYRSPNRDLVVKITCQTQGEYQVLTVEDNGLGMDMRQEEKIFALFKRLHNHVEGTGIGLYIVKKIIDNAGGKIEVESQLEAGSIFRVYFPVTSG